MPNYHLENTPAFPTGTKLASFIAYGATKGEHINVHPLKMLKLITLIRFLTAKMAWPV
jgi:hypothetical protein